MNDVGINFFRQLNKGRFCIIFSLIEMGSEVGGELKGSIFVYLLSKDMYFCLFYLYHVFQASYGIARQLLIQNQ